MRWKSFQAILLINCFRINIWSKFKSWPQFADAHIGIEKSKRLWNPHVNKIKVNILKGFVTVLTVS